ncbi:dimethylarginine dimethylaminohydrolase family protein [Oceanobacillus bengalensis]|uniref:Nitrate reductase n=1 Tax=Oceanobacillus bengalensis TaxID=1435466 RepID=A0A494YSC3_9BACI|nr:dimethylarginine dimethylaminohydrolase family protein [Oceanobacillus bengalensis]RKQ12819.1 hypothetical protein D8M05_17730 [Oceanobacillus bengalensis]
MINSTSTEINPNVRCFNEYDLLKQVIVVAPDFMSIKEVINTTQRHYLKENINIDTALEQHNQFVQTLESEGAKVIKLKAKENLNEQVFTRDIGFTIGNQLFLASMKKDIRKPETDVLVDWLDKQQIAYNKIETFPIEGGDVIIDHDKVWVGVSSRTSLDAIRILQDNLPDFTVHAIPFREDILHLDCVFNIISNDTAIIYSPGVDQDALKVLKEHYHLIEVTEEEQFNLGTNVLSIGNKRMIALPENKRLNEEIRKQGFHVIEVAFSEIIKSGGSFRCCSLPLVRE